MRRKRIYLLKRSSSAFTRVTAGVEDNAPNIRCPHGDARWERRTEISASAREMPLTQSAERSRKASLPSSVFAFAHTGEIDQHRSTTQRSQNEAVQSAHPSPSSCIVASPPQPSRPIACTYGARHVWQERKTSTTCPARRPDPVRAAAMCYDAMQHDHGSGRASRALYTGASAPAVSCRPPPVQLASRACPLPPP